MLSFFRPKSSESDGQTLHPEKFRFETFHNWKTKRSACKSVAGSNFIFQLNLECLPNCLLDNLMSTLCQAVWNPLHSARSIISGAYDLNFCFCYQFFIKTVLSKFVVFNQMIGLGFVSRQIDRLINIWFKLKCLTQGMSVSLPSRLRVSICI